MLSSSVDQTATIDFEIAVHLGEFKNINLSQKGIYAVRIRLLYGPQRRPIMPTGLFSAPSSLDSQTNEHQIPATRFITGCEVDDSDYSCKSRSVMIRYREEKHELNDGVCWRLTLSNLLLPSDGSPILCPELMLISLELLFVELKGGDELVDPMKLYNHPDEFIPDELNFAPVSSQLIALQQITSGFHQYYPVTFTPEQFVEIDMMIHGCITSIRYQHLSFLGTPSTATVTTLTTEEGSRESTVSKAEGGSTGRESIFEVQDTFSSLSVTSSSSHRRTRLSTTIDSASSANTYATKGNITTSSKILGFFANPEKLFFGGTTGTGTTTASSNSSNVIAAAKANNVSSIATSSSSSQSPLAPLVGVDISSSSGSNKQLSSQQQLRQQQLELDAKAMATNPLLQLLLTLSLTRENVQRVFDTYTTPLLTNYRQAVTGSRIVLEHYNSCNNTQSNNNNSGGNGAGLSSWLETQVTDDCVLESSRDQILSELLAILDQQPLNSSTTSSESSGLFFEVDKKLSQVLTKYCHICNEQLALRWALLNSAFRRALPPLQQALYEEYRAESRIFWKQQQIVHTRPYEGSMFINSMKDDDMLMILNQHIAIEREREQQIEDSTLNKSLLFARGKQIFDYRIFRLPSRLPYLLIEQYADFRSADYDNTIANKSRRALIAGTESATLVEHVVFLQHGFLGTSYDMRLLSYALSLVAPKANNNDRGPVLVYACTANEGAGNISIATMGKSLAVEIKQYLQDKAPHLLSSIDSGKIEGGEPMSMLGRISFIGHSLGGLMIRSALEEPELRAILPRLHILMTIATPHLGNLFSDSQLVSTGMWALYTLKKYPALNELVLDDNNSDKEKTILYRLSEASSALSYFKRVILVSSPKDQYVSTYSARLQITPRIEQDQKGMGAVVKKMMTNLMKSIKSDQLMRVTMVNNVEYASSFAKTGNSNGNSSSDRSNTRSNNGSENSKKGQTEAMDVNNVIGRAAHICYLENDVVALQLVEAFEELFFSP